MCMVLSTIVQTYVEIHEDLSLWLRRGYYLEIGNIPNSMYIDLTGIGVF